MYLWQNKMTRLLRKTAETSLGSLLVHWVRHCRKATHSCLYERLGGHNLNKLYFLSPLWKLVEVMWKQFNRSVK